MATINKSLRITNPAPAERLSRETRDTQELFRSKKGVKRRLQPAASVDLMWRCPVCRSPGDAPDDDQKPTCRIEKTFPNEHKQIEEIRALIRTHQNRKVAEFLSRQAEQLSHQLQQKAMRTTVG